ncbi:T9SS type B sorting domain-containing protein [Lacinutrix jangbogonensis]|uniref:T9SS type B sorting domain-containing protein n=1 Tax=Lacinutrix jangbogonensis TaxID=1469557 RepID=UPI00053DC34F|nr:T9SS type B sorting domain-containing protein [Lacinutrix jangbogonensis]
MKKIIIILTTLLCCVFSNAQKEASNWYFGDNAGLNFNLDTDTVSAVSDGQLSTEEGCTSISDSDGNLLLYTDGRIVYNANHGIMPNGTGLKGDPSSTQSAIIIPKPQDPNIYYIFTVDSPSTDGQDFGFNYYEVDLTLDGGLGDVVSNPNTELLANTSEKLSAVLKDCQTQAVWVITFANSTGNGNNNNTFYAYEVTDTGVNTTPVTSLLGFSIGEARGYMKFSPSGEKLAVANVGQGLLLCDFNTDTGIVSFNQAITIDFNSPGGQLQQSYGVEFSPNNNLLYVSTFFSNGGNINDANSQYGGLLQFNLNAADISDSQVILDERQTYRGGLQLGPDGRLYRAMSDTYNNGNPFLSVVNNPNIIGTGCNYQHNAIALTDDSRQGLPPFITSFFSEDIDIIQNGTSTTNLSLCTGDSFTLMAEDLTGGVYTWTQDGLPLAESDFDLIITESGFYKVEIGFNGESCGILEGEANVTYYGIPVATQPGNLQACDNDNDGVADFDFSTQTSTILNGQDSTLFGVRYYASMTDAIGNINEINGTFQNTSASQLIYARIDNLGNRRCSDFTSFEIEVFNTPVITTSNDVDGCDNDANPMDGFTALTLSDFNADILGSQNPTQYTITYYESLIDAEATNNSLPNNYTNQTPITETLFIRIENNNNTDCYSTGSINLIINPIPEAFDTNIYQCDEQGMVDGFTTFNLTEANDDLTGNNPDPSTQFYLSLIEAESDSNEINSNTYNNISNPQTVYVRVTSNLTGCFNFSTLILETSDTQINDYNAQPVCDELESEDGINTFNLDDFSDDILLGLPPGLDITYYQTENDALLENNALSSPYQNTVPYSQILYVRVENDNACYGINQVTLTINPIPSLSDDETVLYCLNEFPTTVTLDAGLSDSSANYSFNWSNSESTETITVNTIGIYTVTVTNNITSCSNTRTISVEPSNIATLEDIEIIDGSLNNNQVIILTSGEGDYQYAITDEEGETSPFQTSNIFTQLSPGIYSVIVRDIKNDCGVTEDIISIIGFPLYFTPNGDSINDTWQVYGVSRLFQPESKIFIFDRFGKLITQINPSDSGWDGTFNGLPLPQSDYWFTVTLQDGRVYKNHFTLKR